MRSPRLLLTALALTAALTACSGDDSSESDAPAGDAASQATDAPSEEESQVPGEERGCRATVSVTGTVEATWEGKATVRGEEAGPSAVYLTADGKQTVTAYAKGEDFPPSVNFYDGTQVFATQPGTATGLDIRPNGKIAEIDAEAFNVGGKTVQVVASFDCAKKKKG
ncbi:hypothetical protein NPS01_26190 [Nocardioides psychrotolerans]|uniref:Lipoprotein antigen n=1 Tax=Nocardioides psychrotolerans TaxID=1005945 RepID=A0A1I3LYA2_9ACTN|nr:hypothetical protein [Nocardioides psychrotolerans]GEP38956.1 hypothetical protein NPS01_26190 [Nocardioides psychrotolerans]SFI89540.1 hypothetical protein SAMN05216561_114126 [Nocardioides psychrotolerans]